MIDAFLPRSRFDDERIPRLDTHPTAVGGSTRSGYRPANIPEQPAPEPGRAAEPQADGCP